MKKPPRIVQYLILGAAVLLLAGFVTYRTQRAAQEAEDLRQAKLAAEAAKTAAERAAADEAVKAMLQNRAVHFSGSKSAEAFSPPTQEFMPGSKVRHVFTERDVPVQRAQQQSGQPASKPTK